MLRENRKGSPARMSVSDSQSERLNQRKRDRMETLVFAVIGSCNMYSQQEVLVQELDDLQPIDLQVLSRL